MQTQSMILHQVHVGVRLTIQKTLVILLGVSSIAVLAVDQTARNAPLVNAQCVILDMLQILILNPAIHVPRTTSEILQPAVLAQAHVKHVLHPIPAQDVKIHTY